MNLKISSNLGVVKIRVNNAREGIEFFSAYVQANIATLTLPIAFTILREEN